MAFGLLSTDDTVRREDLLDLITDVSPDANPLSTMLGTTTASDTIQVGILMVEQSQKMLGMKTLYLNPTEEPLIFTL